MELDYRKSYCNLYISGINSKAVQIGKLRTFQCSAMRRWLSSSSLTEGSSMSSAAAPACSRRLRDIRNATMEHQKQLLRTGRPRFSSDEQMLAVIPHPLTHGAADSSDSINAHRPYKRQRHESGTAPSRFKGVVLQQNGHWGAQIYANHQRIWLGTFKSEQAAAMAYDSAAIKLRSGDCHRNIPWTTLSDREHVFQNLFTTEDVLSMIKEGSYESKFSEYIRSQNAKTAANSGAGFNLGNESGSASQGGVICQELFLKELTPSDVGKLNRLVIPKKHAVKFFPPVLETEEGEEMEDIQLVFFDKFLRSWKFRYCYWKSSQSYVFTRGWNRFVRDKELKARDLVTFYNCEYRKGLEGADRFWMIDVNYNNETDVNAVGALNHEKMAGLELALGRQYTSRSEDEDNEKGEEDEDDQQIVRLPLAKKKCLRLFGVTIG